MLRILQSIPGLSHELIRELEFKKLKLNSLFNNNLTSIESSNSKNKSIENNINDHKKNLAEFLILDSFEESKIKKNIPLSWVQKDFGNFKPYPFSSISEAVSLLKKIQSERKTPCKHLSILNHRRGELIAEPFKNHKETEIHFSASVKNETKKSFILYSVLEKNTIYISENNIESPTLGEYSFIEDKVLPPSRAYLKLWEVFTRLGHIPHAEDLAIDLGSCPGGWTWVLSQFCKKVVSIDGAMIDEKLLREKKIEFLKADSFSLDPLRFGAPQWICSDMICEPEKLYHFAEKWLSAHPKAHFIFTLKFKGPSDFNIIEKFRSIPGSEVIHLFHNKHELTWMRINK